jgi:hypothetical protein
VETSALRLGGGRKDFPCIALLNLGMQLQIIQAPEKEERCVDPRAVNCFLSKTVRGKKNDGLATVLAAATKSWNTLHVHQMLRI